MASEKVTIELDLKLDDGSTKKALGKVEKQAQKSGKKSGDRFSKGFKNGVSTLSAKLKNPMRVVAASFAGIATGSILAAAKVETLTTQFGTLLKSTSAAQKQMASLQEFAASTPFQLEGIADASRQLLAFGFTQEQSISHLTALGDAAASSGADIKDLSQIFGQVRAAGKLTGERLLQLQERAIPIGSVLAKTMGVTESAVKDMVSAGKVDFKTFETAFASLSAKGGLFSGGMEKLSKTTSGLFSTLKDNIFLAFADVGKALEPLTKMVLSNALALTQDLKKNLDPKDIIDGFFQVGRAINLYLVLPLEFLKNTAMTIFNGIRTAVQLLVVGIAKSISGVVFVMNKLGTVSDETYENIKGFAEGSTEVLEEFAVKTKGNMSDMFKTSMFDKGEEALNNLETNLAAATSIIKEKKEEMNEDGGFIGPLMPETFGQDDLFGAMFEGLTDKKDEIGNSLAQITESVKKFGKESRNALVNGFGSAVGASFAAFGKALANGENALKAFGKAFLNSIGQVLMQEGTANILRGIALSLNPMTAGAGGPLIAAGAAMATFGGVISSVGGGSSASASSGGGSTAPGTTSSSLSDSTFDDEDVTPQAGSTVNLTVQGNILDRRESGLELANILNSAIDNDSVVINQSFA